MELLSGPLDHHIGERHADSTERDGDAAGERAAAEGELIPEDHRDAGSAEQQSGQLARGQLVIWQQDVGEDQRERRRQRLQHRAETRRNELGSPVEQRVVEAEEDDPGATNQRPVLSLLRQRDLECKGERHHDQDCDEQPHRRKRDRRHLAYTQLDEHPHRAPQDAGEDPDKDDANHRSTYKPCAVTTHRE